MIEKQKLKKLYVRCLIIASIVSVIFIPQICFAAGDPLSAVNNLSNFVFSLIRAIGIILLGLGIMQVGVRSPHHQHFR